MQEEYHQIEKMEAILDRHAIVLRELFENLDFLKDHFQEFEQLMEYYYSEERKQAIKADEEGILPTDLKRGVLSEDAIYDLYGDYLNASICMLEIATDFFKH